MTSLARSQDDVVTWEQARDAGITPAALRWQLRKGVWSMPMADVICVPPVRDELRAAARGALMTVSPERGAISHRAAARLHRLASTQVGPVDLTLPMDSGRRQRRGVRLHWHHLRPEDVVDLDGLRTTSVPRTVLDLVLATDRVTAVSMIDTALQDGRLTPHDLAGLREDALRGRRRGHLVRTWWEQADGRSESPLETRIRLTLVDAGLRPEVLQHPVTADGRAVARVDLAWPSCRLAIEADGFAWHRDRETFTGDRRRHNALLDLGWEVVRFSWDDSLVPAYVVQTVERALERARRRRAG